MVHSLALAGAMMAFTTGLFILHSRMTIDLTDSASAPKASGQSKRDQIHDDIQDAIGQNARARSYADWRRSGYTPADVFANVRALKSSAAWADLCTGLGDLDSEDLALFEPAIRQYRATRKLRCAGALEARLTEFWASRAAELGRIRGEMPGFPESLVGPRAPLSVHAPDRSTAALGMPLPTSTLTIGSEPGRRQVVLSFEQAGSPQTDRAARILDSLDQFGARAVFFVTGESAKNNPALLRMIAERQHQLGSLGWEEKDLENIPVRDSEEALARAQAEVAVASGAPVTLFRNPLGSTPGDSAGSGMPNLVEEFVVRRQQMHLVPADFDPADWKTTDPVKLFRNATAMLDERNGGVISFRADLEQTAIILPHFLEELRIQGYSVATYTNP